MVCVVCLRFHREWVFAVIANVRGDSWWYDRKARPKDDTYYECEDEKLKAHMQRKIWRKLSKENRDKIINIDGKTAFRDLFFIWDVF